MTTHIKGKGGRYSRVAVEESALGAAHVFLRIDSIDGIHVPAAELRDAVVKASALKDEKSEPDDDGVEPFDRDAVLAAARAYADRQANATWVDAYRDHLDKILPA